MTSREIIEKALIGIMGVTISIAGFLIKWQLTDLTDTIRVQSTHLQQLQIDVAVTAKDVQLHRDWLQSYQGRLQYLEARVERFNTLLERK